MLVLILSCWVGGTFKQCCGAALILAARALILQKFYGSGYGSGSGSGSGKKLQSRRLWLRNTAFMFTTALQRLKTLTCARHLFLGNMTTEPILE